MQILVRARRLALISVFGCVFLSVGLAAQDKTYCVGIDYSKVPTLVNYKTLTVNVNVGVCSAVSVTADGAAIPASYNASTQVASFSTTGASIVVTALNWTSGGTGAATKATLYNNNKWAYSQTFDDVRQTQYANAKPLMDSLGLKAGLSAVVSWLESGNNYYMTWAEIQTFLADGWDIYNHTWDHPNPVTCGTWVTEFGQNQTAFQTKLPGYNVAHTVFPYEVSIATCAGYPPAYLISGELDNGPAFTNVSAPLSTSNTLTVARNGIYGIDNAVLPAIETNCSNAANAANPSWVVYITHSVTAGDGAAADQYSTNVNTLSTLYNYLLTNWGPAGKNNLWFASAGRVQDYLFTRDNAVLSTCAVPSATRTPPVSPSASPSRTPSTTPSSSPSSSPSRTQTQTGSPTRSATASVTHTLIPSPSSSPTASMTISATSNLSDTPTATATPSISSSPTLSRSASVTESPSPTVTVTVSVSLTDTVTPSPPVSWTDTAASSPYPSPTTTVTETASASASSTATSTTSATISATQSVSWTQTGTVFPSATPTGTATASASASMTPTGTNLSSVTSTLTASVTASADTTQTQTAAATATADSAPKLPSLQSILPNTVLAGLTATATITGTGFLPISQVEIGAAMAQVLSQTATTLTVVLPAEGPGSVQVRVLNPGSGSSNSLDMIYSPKPTATAAPGGVLKINQALPVPNPGPMVLAINLAGPADKVTGTLYTVAFRLVKEIAWAPQPVGWDSLPLSGNLVGLPKGLYYLLIRAHRGAAVSASMGVKIYLLN